MAPKTKEQRLAKLKASRSEPQERKMRGKVGVLDDGHLKVSFSSDKAVQRWYGTEVLSHQPGAINLERLKDGATVLFNHDSNQYIGVVEDAWHGENGDNRGHALIRLDDGGKGAEIRRAVQAGILRGISVGYAYDEVEIDEEAERMTATKWTPHEISIVSVPADPTVGIGRKQAATSTPAPALSQSQTRGKSMPPTTAPAQSEKAIRKAEQARMTAILDLAERHKLSPEQRHELITNTSSDLEARAKVLDMVDANRANRIEVLPGVEPIGVETHTIEHAGVRGEADFTLLGALDLAMGRETYAAGRARELTQQMRNAGYKPRSVVTDERNIAVVPWTALLGGNRATYDTGGTATGGALVPTTTMVNQLVEALRPVSVLARAGITVLGGLTGNLKLPKQATTESAYWVAEGAAITQSESTFGEINITPHQLGALSAMTYTMKQQQPQTEPFIRKSLLATMGVALDKSGIDGTGASEQPTGILRTSHINTVDKVAANGGPLTLAMLVDGETALAEDNVDTDQMAFLCSPRSYGALLKLITDSRGAGGFFNAELLASGEVRRTYNGYQIFRSSNMPDRFTKGTGTNLSGILCGIFSELILGQFGPAMEITSDMGIGKDFASGTTNIRAMTLVDWQVRHPEAFALITGLKIS